MTSPNRLNVRIAPSRAVAVSLRPAMRPIVVMLAPVIVRGDGGTSPAIPSTAITLGGEPLTLGGEYITVGA